MLKEIFIRLEKERIEDILYLTDNKTELEALCRQEKKVAFVLTKENYQGDFSGISYAIEKPEELEIEDFEKIYRRLAKLPLQILETKRCIIREMTEADLDVLYEIYKEESITRYIENLYEDREEERRYISDYRKYVYEFYDYGMWIIEEKLTGRIIGRAGIDPKEAENELGYIIGVPWQRKGYAYEVCGAILDYGWTELKLKNVISRVQSDNKISIHLLQKLGFRKMEAATSVKEHMDTYIITQPEAVL